MRRKKDINYIIGIVLLGIVSAILLIGMIHTPYNPNQMDGTAKNMAPSLSHLLGTDNFGRDILSRVMEGSKTTFLVALSTVVIGAGAGTVLGAVTGYYGGFVDEILMRINDAVASFPSILLALVFISIFSTGQYNLIIALGIVFIPSFARVVRSEYITLKERDFVKGAKLMGASDIRIMFHHILPNTKNILFTSIAIGFNNAILAEAGMSYLGLGVQPPDASLGRMLSEAQPYLFSAPWYALAPGIMIMLTVLGFTMIIDS